MACPFARPGCRQVVVRLRRPAPAPRYSGGFTYIGLMILVALMGIGLALAGQGWHVATQREKEQELLFVGDQFRNAIARYYEASPGGVKKFPNALEDLLEDRRYPTMKRHLRRIYRDPLTGETTWGMVEAPTGGIMAVYSLSDREPRKTAGFRERDEAFTGATSYADWKFGYAATAIAQSDAVAAPVPASPNPVVAPTLIPEPVVSSKDDPNRKKICESFSRSDRDTCSIIRSRDGTDGGARCEQSAAARKQACMDAVPLPPLDIPIVQ